MALRKRRISESSSRSCWKNWRLWWSRTSKETWFRKGKSWSFRFIRVLDCTILYTRFLGLFPADGNFLFQVLLDDYGRYLFLTFFHKCTRILLLLERTQRKASRIHLRAGNEHVCGCSKERNVVQYVQQTSKYASFVLAATMIYLI